ncbi:hypothetical protein H0H92_006256 [Tricholoma furcatifolium]|nr:hypothetical protein H0H92_006256 [Tricholoma furcatifolium]
MAPHITVHTYIPTINTYLTPAHQTSARVYISSSTRLWRVNTTSASTSGQETPIDSDRDLDDVSIAGPQHTTKTRTMQDAQSGVCWALSGVGRPGRPEEQEEGVLVPRERVPEGNEKGTREERRGWGWWLVRAREPPRFYRVLPPIVTTTSRTPNEPRPRTLYRHLSHLPLQTQTRHLQPPSGKAEAPTHGRTS